MYRFVVGTAVGLATFLGVVAAPAYAADPTPHRIIFATDVCDGPSFNAAAGPGTCARAAGVPFNIFVAEVTRLHQAPGWAFTPGVVSATTTDPIQVRDIGGEVHTFTEVAKFGGGFVPLLNDLAGTPVPAPECFAPPNEDNHILVPGQAFTFTEGAPGTHLYQCCIHPWMHETLTVRSALTLNLP